MDEKSMEKGHRNTQLFLFLEVQPLCARMSIAWDMPDDILHDVRDVNIARVNFDLEQNSCGRCLS